MPLLLFGLPLLSLLLLASSFKFRKPTYLLVLGLMLLLAIDTIGDTWDRIQDIQSPSPRLQVIYDAQPQLAPLVTPQLFITPLVALGVLGILLLGYRREFSAPKVTP